MNFSAFMVGLVIFTAASVFTASEGKTKFTYQASYGWSRSKQQCECSGNLAILDTEAKQTQLLADVNIPAGKCAWIGASSWGTGQYRWIELPPNYGSATTNGELLSNTYNNFTSGDVPEAPSDSTKAVCIYSNGTWHTYKVSNNKRGGHVCEWTECAAGYYGNRTNCTACSGTMVKPSQGDASDCDSECDPVKSTPNSNHTHCVCNVGYFRDGSDCLLCTGNTIKTTPGNEPNCDADPPCDGSTTVPNAEHTDYVCLAGHKMLADGFFSKERSVTYNLKQRDVELTDGLISLQVVSKTKCGAECLERNCKGFSFLLLPPDGRICNIIMANNVAYQPLEGAAYYVTLGH